MNNKKTCLALAISAVLASANIAGASERYVNESYLPNYSNQNWSNLNSAGKRFEAPDDENQWGNYYDEATKTYKPLPNGFYDVGDKQGDYNLVDGKYEYVGPNQGNYVYVQYGYGDLMPGQEETYGGGFENIGLMNNLSNNTFKNNKADFGGGMANSGYLAIIQNMENNTFTNNTAVQDGGAIYNFSTIGKISGTFTGNKAEGLDSGGFFDGDAGNGGAIFNFGGPLGKDVDGNPIRWGADIESIDGKFDKNTAQWHGGAIYNGGEIGSISGTYTNNNALTGQGGAIFNNEYATEHFDADENTEAFDMYYGYIKDINGKFSGNSANQGGGAIYNRGKIETVQGEFTNNNGMHGGAIMNDGEIATLDAPSFKGNSATEKGGAVYNTGKIYSQGNIKYENNSAQTGGAIANEGTFNISRYSTFTGNKAQDGGAVYNNGEITVSSLANQSFTNNIADGKGGAIFNEGKMALGGNPDVHGGSQNSVTFKGNNAQDGGAIYNTGDLTVQKTTFDKNTATNGGAIYQKTSALNLNNLKFTNNTAEKGGAIYAGEGSTVTLGNNEFKGNSAQKGGLLYLENATANITADKNDVVFAGNTADKGSAFYLENGTVNLNTSAGKNITFNDSIAGSGVINTSGNIILNNSVTPDEGALSVNVNSGIIKSSVDNYLNGVDLHLANGTTLDLMNGQTGVLNLNSLISDNANLKIDMDLANSASPFDTINANTASGTLNISDVNFISEMADGNNQVSAPVNLDQLTLNFPNMHITTNNSFYVISKNDDNITIDRLHDEEGNPIQVDGFTLAVNKDSTAGGVDISMNDERSFSATDDVTVTGSGIDGGWTGNLGGTKLTINGNNHTIDGNNKSGITVHDNQTLEINNANIKGFDGNAIYLDGTGLANTVLGTSGKMSVDNNIGSTNSANTLKITGNGTLNLNGTVDNLTLVNENSNTIHNNKVTNSIYNFTNGTASFAKDEYLSDNNNSLIFNGGTLNVANGAVNQININEMSLNSNSNIMVDADLASKTMDTLNASTINIGDDVKLNVSGINLLSDTKDKYTEINFVNDETLKDHITTSVQSVRAYSPIYKYNVGYDPTTGNFGFTRGTGNKYSEVNPAIMVAPVAAQIGGYLTQLNTYDQAFANMDMTMLMTREQRQAMKLYNKVAIRDTFAPVGIIPDTPGVISEENAGIWGRPYTTFENVKLKNGPKVNNVMYGSFFGGDTSIKEFRHGFDGIFSAYVGYNGSHQTFDGNSMYQNGASVGVTGTLYKGNWYGGWTVAGGINGVDANTMYGSDNFMMWSAGTALKTGYNWEFFRNRFIIQPHLMASYTFVDTEDFRNSASYKISSDPLNAIQIVPGIKFIGNLKNSWQPYLGIDYVWNIMDKTKFNVADASLPQLSVKPYIQYGVGVQKRWGERFTGFLQAMFRGGGRNGVIFSFGFRSTLGRKSNLNQSL